MTTRRRTAEALLFVVTMEDVINVDNVPLPESMTTSPSPTRRRIQPSYCPRCSSWVEIKLQPGRLHCTGCGLEARP